MSLAVKATLNTALPSKRHLWYAAQTLASAALKEGIEYPALINRIVELASARYSR